MMENGIVACKTVRKTFAGDPMVLCACYDEVELFKLGTVPEPIDCLDLGMALEVECHLYDIDRLPTQLPRSPPNIKCVRRLQTR